MTLTRICICGLLVSLSQVSSVQEENLEDKYVEIFKTDLVSWRGSLDPIWSFGRTLVEESKGEKGPTQLNAFCELAHLRGGFGSVVVYNAFMNASWLKFKNEKYTQIRIDVITYDAKDKNTGVEANRRYITQGFRAECVFFLTRANDKKLDYHLDKYTCGIVLPSEEWGK